MEGVPINSIAEIIELSIAPVFMLTGIAGILSVLSHRLSRVIDRTRVVKRFIHEIKSQENLDVLKREADSLSKRTKLINFAIRLSVGSALAICVVIMSLFIGDLAVYNLGTLIAVLFVLAMLLISTSLLLLILEVSISTRNMQDDIEYLLVEAKKDN